MTRSFLWILLLALLPVGQASAGDGRIEINQARALAGGVSGLDSSGFPVTLTGPASYVLTSDLVVTNATAINGTVDDTTLDLNGFSIVGPVTCSGNPVSCTPAGSYHGIELIGQGNEIKNGTVRGFHLDGIRLLGPAQKESRVFDLRVRENGRDGILAPGLACTIRDNQVVSNGGKAISTGDHSRVANNLVRNCGDVCIVVGPQALVDANLIVPVGTPTALDTSSASGASASGYRNNLIVGTVLGGGVDLGGNLCNGATCP